MQRKTIALVKCAGTAAVLFLISGTASAIFYPSIQITGGPSVNVCNSVAFSLPVNVNVSTSTSNSSTMTVAGVGTVFTLQQNNPTINGPTNYGIAPSAYSVPNGTQITVNIRTFNSINQTGGQSWDSTIVFACDTGAIISLVNSGLPIPTLSEWVLALLALLVAITGASMLLRRRVSN